MNLWNEIFSYLLPQSCLTCSAVLPLEEKSPLCQGCLQKVQFIQNPFCTHCGDPFENAEMPSHLCGDCLKESPPFQWARSVFKLEPTLGKLVHALKYQGQETGLNWLAQKTFENVGLTLRQTSIDVIVPVPLHPWRLRRRGYNQTLLLARALQKQVSFRVEPGALVRKHFKKPQVRQSREERFKQIKGAFVLKNPSVWQDKKVLILDDVYTTGATLMECSRVFKKAGAVVYGLTVARTPLIWK